MDQTQPRKSSIFSAIKEVFIETLPDKDQSTSTPAHTHTSNGSVYTAPKLAVAAPLQSDIDKFEALLQRSAPPEYIRFMEQYALLDDISDERVRFKAALKTSRLQPSDVVAMLDSLLAAVDQLSSSFDSRHATETTTVLENVRTQAAANKAAILEVIEKIAQLSKQKEELQAHEAVLQQEQVELDRRMAQIRTSFMGAKEQVTRRLRAQRENIIQLGK